MKILIDSYNTVTQNVCGGVNIKIKEISKRLQPFADVKLFDKWNDKVQDYDILHVFSLTDEAYSFVNVAHKKGLKIVVSAIVNPSNRLKIFLNRFAAKFLRQMNSYKKNKHILDVADAIICETEREKNFVVKAYSVDGNKVCVIPNGVDKVREDASEEYFRRKTGIKGKFILQVGRFDPNKNQLSVIEAVKGTDMQLVLIGGADNNHEEYYNKCKATAGENVHFLGWIDHNDPLLYSAYRAAQVFVIPSHKEIFGNAMFESGIYGCNIVATKALPLDTWEFGKYCHVIDPKNIEDIKNKLSDAYCSAKNSFISDIIEKKFSWESVINDHVEIYESILKERG